MVAAVNLKFLVFGQWRGSSIYRRKRPDTVFTALERLGSTVEHAVYIGDSEVDAATARNAGMDCILVSWGFRERELLASYDPVAIADQPSDIWEILNR